MTLIYPATDRHLDKYRESELELVTESWEHYENVTLPHIQAGNAFNLKWVRNFLEHKAEQDRVIFEDEHPKYGFMLAPDLKWDGKDLQTLYVTAIVHSNEVHSLRSLTGDRLQLLRNVRDRGLLAIFTKYGLPKNQIRAFLHYQPSYYHLHVHFTHVKADVPGLGAGKAHLLNDVIDCLELWPDYFQRRTLTFILRKSDPLLTKLKEYVVSSQNTASSATKKRSTQPAETVVYKAAPVGSNEARPSEQSLNVPETDTSPDKIST